eukprot:scaffold156713_cov17-Cyclotella_meneghiniana.AAC.1
MPSPAKLPLLPPPMATATATADEVDAFMEAEMKKAADNNDDDVDMAAAVADEIIPEGVAALDAKLAPYMKNPEEETRVAQLKHQYIAVRLGYAVPVMGVPGP